MLVVEAERVFDVVAMGVLVLLRLELCVRHCRQDPIAYRRPMSIRSSLARATKEKTAFVLVGYLVGFWLYRLVLQQKILVLVDHSGRKHLSRTWIRLPRRS